LWLLFGLFLPLALLTSLLWFSGSALALSATKAHSSFTPPLLFLCQKTQLPNISGHAAVNDDAYGNNDDDDQSFGECPGPRKIVSLNLDTVKAFSVFIFGYNCKIGRQTTKSVT
jgi:hypothetical protein